MISKRTRLLEKLNMASVHDIVATRYKNSFHNVLGTDFWRTNRLNDRLDNRFKICDGAI
jgi:hypothetical protein